MEEAAAVEYSGTRLHSIRQCEKLIGDRVEGDALICDETRDPVLVRLAQMMAAEGISCR